MSKLEYAKCAAAALAYLVLHQQDSVGLATFDHEIRTVVRPSGNPSHLKELLQRDGARRGPSGRRPRARSSTNWPSGSSKRGIVVILSDLFDDVDAILAGLKHFRHRRHEVILMHVLDPAEFDFPFQQTTMFRGLEALPEVLVEPRAVRQAYLDEFGKFLRRVKQGCRQHRIDYVCLRHRPIVGGRIVQPIWPRGE